MLKVRIGGQESEQQLKPASANAAYKFRFRGVDAKLAEIIIPRPTRPLDIRN